MREKISYLLLLSVLTFHFSDVTGQFSHQSLYIGYSSAKMKMDNFAYHYEPPAVALEPGTFSQEVPATFKLNAIQLGGEIINNRFYISAGTNMSLKIPREIEGLDSTKHIAYESNYIFMKAAAGWGGDHFSFLIGAQYEFNRFMFREGYLQYYSISSSGVGPDIPGNYNFNFFGGHQYGFNFNFLFMPNSSICLRTSLFADKVTMNGIPHNVHFNFKFRGSSIRPELALYLYAGEDKNLGLKFTYTYAKRELDCYTGEKDNPIPTYVPLSSTKTSYYAISLLLKAPWAD
jgi:hypothetical protein